VPKSAPDAGTATDAAELGPDGAAATDAAELGPDGAAATDAAGPAGDGGVADDGVPARDAAAAGDGSSPPSDANAAPGAKPHAVSSGCGCRLGGEAPPATAVLWLALIAWLGPRRLRSRGRSRRIDVLARE